MSTCFALSCEVAPSEVLSTSNSAARLFARERTEGTYMYGGLEQTVSRRLKARSCEELKVLCVDRGYGGAPI